MTKRVYDIAGCNPSVKVHLNGTRVSINSFDKYVAMYLKKPVSNAMDDEGNPLPQGTSSASAILICVFFDILSTSCSFRRALKDLFSRCDKGATHSEGYAYWSLGGHRNHYWDRLSTSMLNNCCSF
jgi:hypothetical protein